MQATRIASLIVAGFAAAVGAQAPSAENSTLTAVDGLKVGHYTLAERPTGCTVVVAEEGAVASVDVRGGAPGTRETDLLHPVNTVQRVNAIVLAGGSAFGLDAATGAMKYLEERGIGFDARVAKVPIVPAAILFDLGFGGDAKIRPNADCGYKAAAGATSAPVQEGNVGAGAGATVGKMAGPAHAMKSGIGTTAIRMPDGLVVAALVAVNAVGDVIDPATAHIVAGTRGAEGTGFADARRLILAGPPGGRSGENTTIGVVATNATLTKTEALKVAEMAHDGFARAIYPVHTAADGDTIFSLATGKLKQPANVSQIGALAAEAMARAIVRAATQATSLGGLPAARDIK